MSDKEHKNDTYLIVHAIDRQTEILENFLFEIKKTSTENQHLLKEIDRTTSENLKILKNMNKTINNNNETLKQISTERCINSSIEYNCYTIKFRTFMMMLLLLQIMILLSINNIDVSTIQSMILSLMQ